MKKALRFAFLVLSASGPLCVGPRAVADTTIYADAFPGSSSNPLNGTTPATESGTFGGSAGTPWSAASNFNAAGGVQPSGTFVSAYLPFAPQAGNIYTLSADLNTTSGGSNWIGLNFFDLNDGSQDVWMLLSAQRGVATGAFYPGDGGVFGYDQPNGTVTLSMVLDTTGANWTETFFANGISVGGPMTPSVQPGIDAVGLYQYNNGAGTAGNFTLTRAVPEPGSAALLTLGAGALFIRRQRRNNTAA